MTVETYSPIQVVIDIRRFQNERIRPPGGKLKEFFEGDDAGFVAHRKKIQQSIQSVQRILASSSAGHVGFVRVRMRESALAKSHRPTGSLFPPTVTPTVGTSGIGELIVQVTPNTLSRTLIEAGKAEDALAYKKKKNKPDEVEPNPSRMRSEVGAIESISLWSPVDRRGFDASEAVSWFETRAVPKAYRIDLFDAHQPEQRQASAEFEQAGDVLEKLQQSIDEELSCGYIATVYRPDSRSMSRMYIWLFEDPQVRRIVAPANLKVVLDKAPRPSLLVKSHQQLLSVVENHPAVRRISLPTNLHPNATSATQSSLRGRPHIFSVPQPGAIYPVVGIIDGGVSHIPAKWVIHETDYVRAGHTDPSHGTEIGTLLIDGQSLNGPIVCPEPDGCWLANLALIPTGNQYDTYYKYEEDLVTQIEQDVQAAQTSVGARVFNFSHNIEEPPGGNPTYTDLSRGLDRIARELDVIFVVSAGNAGVSTGRREWSANQVAVLSNLASCSGDRITAPADSVLNVAVGSVNPPAVAGAVAAAPARYSRRGPGFKQLVKPDVAHYGGVCGSTGSDSGLQSVGSAGLVKYVHGTSFSAPLVAKAIARYDLITEGSLPRESLIALLIHGAVVPICLSSFNKNEIVRNFVGFGIPLNAQELIDGSPHSATLLFHDQMMPKKDLFFEFDWPQSLVANGKCRGHATLTLVYTPPLSDAYENEFVRVNLDASLQQMNIKKAKFEKACADTFSESGSTSGVREKELVEEGLKWGVVKQSQYLSARGAGSSSTWRIALKYLVRANDNFPEKGIPFAMILTITDPKQESPVYQDMKIGLSHRQVFTNDIRQSSGRVQTRGG